MCNLSTVEPALSSRLHWPRDIQPALFPLARANSHPRAPSSLTGFLSFAVRFRYLRCRPFLLSFPPSVRRYLPCDGARKREGKEKGRQRAVRICLTVGKRAGAHLIPAHGALRVQRSHGQDANDALCRIKVSAAIPAAESNDAEGCISVAVYLHTFSGMLFVCWFLSSSPWPSSCISYRSVPPEQVFHFFPPFCVYPFVSSFVHGQGSALFASTVQNMIIIFLEMDILFI